MPSSMARVKYGADGLDLGAGGREALGRGSHRGGDLGIDRQAGAGIEQQADLQAAHITLEPRPGDVLGRQAHRVAIVGLRQHAHQQRGVGDALRHRPGAAAGVGRVDRNAAEARLEGEDAAPGRGQAQRPADVGADVQRPVAGRHRCARAGAAAARALAQVPGVARQRMEARQARRQHAVVGHGRLAEDHRARLAHPRCRRRVARRRHQRARRGAHRHRRAAGGDVLLDRRRHAVDRAERRALSPTQLGGARRGPRRFADRAHRSP